MTDTSYVAQKYAGQMPTCQNKAAQAQERLKIIRGYEFQSSRNRKSSAKIDTGSNTSVGLTLAAQAKAANQRQALLAKEFDNVQELKPGYASGMQRFNRLQNTAGILDIALSQEPGRRISNYITSSEDVNRDLDSKKAVSNLFQDQLLDPKGHLANSNVIADLDGVLADLAETSSNHKLGEDIKEVRDKIESFQTQIFSFTGSSSLIDISVRSEGHQGNNGYSNYVTVAANHLSCSSLGAESEYSKLKDQLGIMLRDSYALAKKVEVLAKTAKNGDALRIAASKVEQNVAKILRTSDQVLMTEYKQLSAEKN